LGIKAGRKKMYQSRDFTQSIKGGGGNFRNQVGQGTQRDFRLVGFLAGEGREWDCRRKEEDVK